MRISAVGILTALVIGCAASVALASTAAVAQTPSPLEIQAPTVAPPGQMPEMTPREALEMLRLCSADQGALCAGIPPGGGRVTSCLAENAAVLSPPCYGALSALGAIRGSHSNQPSAGIPIEIKGGTFIVPVTINGQITLKFVIDSGATDVAVPADVVLTLIRTGSIMREDSLGQQRYRLADGSVMPSPVFRIRSLKVGDKVLKNVRASVASVKGSLLLGQSFLNRFNSWSVDNKNGLLFLN